MIDYRYFLVDIIAIFLFALLIDSDYHDDSYNYQSNRITDHNPELQDQMEINGDYDIYIAPQFFNKSVDTITKYVQQGNTDSQKAIYGYMATFRLFNFNIHHKRLEKLNNRLQGVKLRKETISFPHWSKYDNLQIAIVNVVLSDLILNSRTFQNDWKQDRKIVEVYFETLLQMLQIDYDK